MKNFKMLSLALAAFFIVSASTLLAKENPRGIRKGYQAKFQQWAEANPKEAKRFNSLAKKHPEAAKWFYVEARKNPQVANQLYKEAKNNPLLAKSVYEASQKNNRYSKTKRGAKEGGKHSGHFKKFDRSKRDGTMKRGDKLKRDDRKEGRPYTPKHNKESNEESTQEKE